MLHAKDAVTARHDIVGDGDCIIPRGTHGMVLKFRNFDRPTYRVEFSFGSYPRETAVIDDLTDADLQKVAAPEHASER